MRLSSSHRAIPKRKLQPKNGKQRLTVGQYLVKRLEKLRVLHLFTNPTSLTLPFRKIITHDSAITQVHSLFAFDMTRGYASSGSLAPLLLTLDDLKKEFTNIVDAFCKSLPLALIVITKEKQKKEDALSQFGFKTVFEELTEAQRKLIKKSFLSYTVLDNPQTAAKKIDRILDAAIFYQKPICIELSEKMVETFIPPHRAKQTTFTGSDPECLRDAFKHIKHLLETSKKPFLCIGRDVAALRSSEAVLELAEKFEIPMMTTAVGRGTIDEKHPLYIGTYGQKICQKICKDADLAIFIGVGNLKVEPAEHTAFIFEQDTIIDRARYPQVSLYELIKQLGHIRSGKKQSLPAKQKHHHFRAIRNEEISLERLCQCLMQYIDHETQLTVCNELLLLCLQPFAFPKGSFLHGNLAAAFGAGCINSYKRPLVLLTEDELFAHLQELFNPIVRKITPLLIVLRKSSLSPLIIPTSFLHAVVANENELDDAFKQGLRKHEPILLEVMVDNF